MDVCRRGKHSARIHVKRRFEDVRTAVAESLNRRFGTSFTMDNNMSVGRRGLNVVFRTLLNPGDEVIAIALTC